MLIFMSDHDVNADILSAEIHGKKQFKRINCNYNELIQFSLGVYVPMELFLVGRISITASISLGVMGMFRWSI